MRRLIDELFLEEFTDEAALPGDDAAVMELGMKPGDRLAMSTDSFVVTPHFFPGGNIGHLAVCGTVNDVATAGAEVKYLSCGFVLEEGYPDRLPARVIGEDHGGHGGRGRGGHRDRRHQGGRARPRRRRVHQHGRRGRGAGGDVRSRARAASPATRCSCWSGTLGDHGIAIISQREGLAFSTTIESDAAPLNGLIADVLAAAPNARAFRDPTRGGLASTLNEFAESSGVDILVDEALVPVRDEVRGACEMLGYDVFQVANEGKMVAVVPADEAEAALAAMRANKYGTDATIIGEACAPDIHGGHTVRLRTPFRADDAILDMLVGEQLPRIC